ncbi:MAG: hypothetical protein ACO1N9_07390 [Flavobacterium sp.]
MKTNSLKNGLAGLMMMIAAFTAFSFKEPENEKLLAPQIGWLNLPAMPCAIEVMCDNSLGRICTAMYQGTSYQAFGKFHPSSPTCDLILYRQE